MADFDRNDPVEQFIVEAFEDNYEAVRVDTARPLSPAGREAALRQVLVYWRRMREVAERVTDTEVKLTLPNQRSPLGRGFSINGVVDIVREEDHTTMYDIKTHDEAYVRKHKGLYEEQLNVYAHIWHALRGEPLDESAVIATRFPQEIQQALDAGDEEALQHYLRQWDPLVPIPFDLERVRSTIEEFSRAVDDIEEGHFDPPPTERLTETVYGNETFAYRTCRQCDARFSCDAYREYMTEAAGRGRSTYWRFLEGYEGDPGQESWVTANLEAAPTADELAADFDR
ncbi:MAG: PD-(D/E)XK nuclease family protein [bacterium]